MVDTAAAGETSEATVAAEVTIVAAITMSIEGVIVVDIVEDKIGTVMMTGITLVKRDKRKEAVIEEIEVDLEEGVEMMGGSITEGQEEIEVEEDISMGQEENMLGMPWVAVGRSSLIRSKILMTLITIRMIRMNPSQISRKILSLIT